jgi:ankyrin repeat protein
MRRSLPLVLSLAFVAAAPARADEEGGKERSEHLAQAIASARAGSVDQLHEALAAGASVDSRSRVGDSLLLLAIKGGHGVYALETLARGADPARPNAAGVTPLMAAAFQGDLPVLRALLERHVPLDAEDRVHKTAMVYAAGSGRTEAVSLLLDAGVPVDARYDAQLTALMWAAGSGQEPTVRLLLQRGAHAALADDRGKTALQMAREGGHEAVAALLQERP